MKFLPQKIQQPTVFEKVRYYAFFNKIIYNLRDLFLYSSNNVYYSNAV